MAGSLSGSDEGRRPPAPTGRRTALVLLCGLVLPQAILLWPALAGSRILLDLPILALPTMYLPVGPPHPLPHDRVLSDAVLVFEPQRVYAARAVRAGRLPLWNPHNYCGSPFLAANQTALFSPYRLLDYLWPAPTALAWGQLAKAIVAGVGAFLYFRRALGLGVPASVIAGWCFPLCGFLTLWFSHPLSAAASWLPWVLLAAHSSARGRSGLAPVGLALATAATLTSGHAATGVHVLVAGAAQALLAVLGGKGRTGRDAARGALRTLAGFALGVALSGPQTLPTLEYLSSSHRMAARERGFVATPPAGLAALPQVVLPYYDGATRTGGVLLAGQNRPESAAAAYAGFLLVLVAAPLAFIERRRGALVLAAVLVVLGLAQVLDLPLLAPALDGWPLRALRNNRLTLLAAFGLLTLGALGLDALAKAPRITARRALLCAIPAALLGVLCLHRALVPPAALERALGGLAPFPAAAVRAWFVALCTWGLALSAVALGCWLVLWRRPPGRTPVWPLGLLCLGELTASALDVFPLSDPALYYPRLPVLARLAAAPPGRICGVACLPPNLNETAALADVRGYDAVDPARIVELLETIADPEGPPSPEYARTLLFTPKRPSPVADMLGLRYLVHRGTPPAGVRPLLSGDDYFVLENPAALPRAWVPRRVEVVSDPATRLRRLADPAFDPREVAFAEAPPALRGEESRGAARLVRDEGERVSIATDMETDGLVVLADLWDPGWKAFLGGERREVLRVNHALRGVVVPRGRSTLEFRYEPASFRLGVLAFAIALVLAAVRVVLVARRQPPPA